jgi:hypothetical protein
MRRNVVESQSVAIIVSVILCGGRCTDDVGERADDDAEHEATDQHGEDGVDLRGGCEVLFGA